MKMYKLLIVDDEILVQVGIQSMISQTGLELEVCGSARNGQAALKMIEELSPDIVITDIKMPVMDGLELVKACQERYGNSPPFFIILTSYEDFHMAKQALTYHVSDYIVKLELTPEVLKESISRAISQLKRDEKPKSDTSVSVHPFYDKFFISLLHNLFESEEQLMLHSRDLKLDLHYAGYVCCYGEIISEQTDSLTMEQLLSLFTSSLQMVRELAVKYMPCYLLSLDIWHFALIFCYEEKNEDINIERYYGAEITEILNHISKTLKNYYNVNLHCGIGSLVEQLSTISDSYQYSRLAYQECSHEQPITFFEQCRTDDMAHSSFNIGLFKNDLSRAFEEYDPEILQKTISSICELFSTYPQYRVQALDAACNILYLAISMLQDGEAVVSEIFKDSPNGYRSIYNQSSMEQIVNWLNIFEKGLSQHFESRHRVYKNHIVINVKKYINEHITERLSLNDVAEVFSISSSYLSQLFGKYNDTGFSEYINICKVNESKKLLSGGKYKVYEIADMLGFESPFYFSKVFKKIEGVSPTEYLNEQCM